MIVRGRILLEQIYTKERKYEPVLKHNVGEEKDA